MVYPRIMGHEFVGRGGRGRPRRDRREARAIASPSSRTTPAAAARSVVEGNRNLCLSRTALGIDVDGGFAELARVPARCCWPAAGGPRPGRRAARRAPGGRGPGRRSGRACRRGETAAVLGAGTLGLLALQVLRARGARVLVVSRTSRRFDLARELGAERTHVAGRRGAGDGGARLLGPRGRGPGRRDRGHARGRRRTRSPSCDPGGRVVLTGLPHAAAPLSILLRRPPRDHDPRVDDLPGRVPRGPAPARRRPGTGARPLITHRFGLAAIAEAFVAHRDPASIKVALVPSGTT